MFLELGDIYVILLKYETGILISAFQQHLSANATSMLVTLPSETSQIPRLFRRDRRRSKKGRCGGKTRQSSPFDALGANFGPSHPNDDDPERISNGSGRPLG